GIICCFKALYRCNFCSHAIDLDAVGEHEIYKINLLEGMTMAKKAWDLVSAETIKHCWNHSKIQPDDSEPSSYPAHIDPIVWDFICQYATGTMSLLTAESSLQAHLGNHYVNSDWQPVLKVVMESEDDNAALDAPTQKPTQLVSAKLEVMEPVHHLRERNCIHGKPLSVDEIIEPPEERDLPESILDGGMKVIADEVC
ncbi:hypothetical protein SCLCIDRAFT_124880, partial [Scleroderma citrinum Foug A]